MNLRYACLILPAVCIFVGYFASLSKYLKLVVLVVVLLQSLWLTKPANFVILKEANQATPQEELVIAEWLKDNYKGGRILIAVGLTGLDAVIFHSQLPMNRFISEGQGEYWQGGLRELKGVDWVITKPRDEVWQSVIAREKFTDSFVKVFETKNIFVYKRKNLP